MINIANSTNIFLRRDGGNTAIGAIDMNSYITKSVADPVSNQDVATKNYIDKNAITTAGGVVSDDIKLSVGSYLIRCLGSNDLTTSKKVTLLLGSDNVLPYSLPDSQLKVAIKINTDGGFIILINQLPICNFGQDVILCSQLIDMNLHLIKNVKRLVKRFDAVNKAYADCIKYKTAISKIPNSVMTTIHSSRFPLRKLLPVK